MSSPGARTLEPAAQKQLRLQAVRLRESGYTQLEVAEICAVRLGTVNAWHNHFYRGGKAVLLRRLSVKRHLRTAQERWITHKFPEQLHFPLVLWTRRLSNVGLACVYHCQPLDAACRILKVK